MLFDALYESSKRQELILVDGGLCRFHLRKDGQLTIYEIISQRPGAGQAMLNRLRHVPGATCLLARCPAHLASNAWYARRGFVQIAVEQTRRGNSINVWRLDL